MFTPPGDLCQKGYARINEFEAHQSSYDHMHSKRLKEVRSMHKDPWASAKARAAEQKANEEAGLKPISLASIGIVNKQEGQQKRKAVFKSTLQPHNVSAVVGSAANEAGAAQTKLDLSDDKDSSRPSVVQPVQASTDDLMPGVSDVALLPATPGERLQHVISAGARGNESWIENDGVDDEDDNAIIPAAASFPPFKRQRMQEDQVSLPPQTSLRTMTAAELEAYNAAPFDPFAEVLLSFEDKWPRKTAWNDEGEMQKWDRQYADYLAAKVQSCVLMTEYEWSRVEEWEGMGFSMEDGE